MATELVRIVAAYLCCAVICEFLVFYLPSLWDNCHFVFFIQYILYCAWLKRSRWCRCFYESVVYFLVVCKNLNSSASSSLIVENLYELFFVALSSAVNNRIIFTCEILFHHVRHSMIQTKNILMREPWREGGIVLGDIYVFSSVNREYYSVTQHWCVLG